jgi:hypothetical protein
MDAIGNYAAWVMDESASEYRDAISQWAGPLFWSIDNTGSIEDYNAQIFADWEDVIPPILLRQP